MLEKLRKDRGEEGFTLIELLVVIIIIGILAAIAIPVFLNQRSKGWDAAVQSDLRNAATAQETYLTEGNPGQYTASDADLVTSGFKYSAPGNYANNTATMDVYAVGGAAYCMVAQSQSGGWFWYDSFTGPGKSTGATAAAPATTGTGTAADPICS
jgi:type IV pilus assembly protein PilA